MTIHNRARTAIGATLGAVALSGAFVFGGTASAATYGVSAPAPQAHLSQPGQGVQHLVLAGGCFWGMEEVFSHVRGVTNVVSGYAGGDRAHANYTDSSTGRYGDAESVKISYDPTRISMDQLLRIYFSAAHDPTQVDRQGPDRGSQYRSEIFAANAAQARVARAYIKQLTQAHVYDRPIATKVSVGQAFYPAEGYHQNYAPQHPDSLYLRINDAPKVDALAKRFPQLYQSHFIGA